MSLPVHRKLLQLAGLAKFMKEQIIYEIFLNDRITVLESGKITPFLIITSHRSPHPFSDHSHLPLLKPLPFALPHTTHNSSLLPTHGSPQCSRNPQQSCGDDRSCLFNLCSVTTCLITVLQLNKLAKFIKEQFTS